MAMHPLWPVLWLVSTGLASHSLELSDAASMTSAMPPANHTKSRALSLEKRQDATNYQGYYPYPPAPYPPPSYGPPSTEIPQGGVHIEFAFDEIVLRCVAEEPFEHIIWTRYHCPQQFLFGGDGEHVADGSSVYQSNLYDVHIRGHSGTIISELLIKNPLAESSEGIYQCEVWPHIHGTGGSYPPYGQYQSYHPPKSGIFIIGGSSLLEDCYRFNGYGHQTKQITSNTNIHGKTSNKDVQMKQNISSIKPRRNVTQREDSDFKKLQYNLEYDNNTLYNINGDNVTGDFFHPSYKTPFDLLYKFPKHLRARAQKYSNNLSGFARDFIHRKNDKFGDVYILKQEQTTPKINLFSNSSSESLVSS